MSVGLGSILSKLNRGDILIPLLESAVLQDKWPESYQVTIDSGEYYGSRSVPGEESRTGAGDGFFHPSTHTILSERELYFLMHPEHAREARGAGPDFGFSTMMSLSVGTALHAIVQTQLNMIGLLKKGEGPETAIHRHSEEPNVVDALFPPEDPLEWEYINRTHNIRGRSDGVLIIPGHDEMIFEMKTASSGSFALLKEPKNVWLNQINLGMAARGVDRAILLVTQIGFPWQMKEWVIERDQPRIDAIYEKFDRVMEAVKKDVPPPCRCSWTSGSPDCTMSALCERMK